MSNTEQPKQEFHYFDLPQLLPDTLSKYPMTIKLLLENLLRHEDGQRVTSEHIQSLIDWKSPDSQGKEIPFFPSRVLLQDLSGIPLLVDLAAMRDAMQDMKGDPLAINPLTPMELVIDHSIMVDNYGTPESHEINKKEDYLRNNERYKFFKWAQQSLKNVRIIPPHTGIVHQINIEYLARGVFVEKVSENNYQMYPDTVVGTDSHTTMVNGIGLLGWGVGGIEAEAVALGQPIPLTIPTVVGVYLTGTVTPGVTATDLVLTLTEKLREYGVVNKFVEFFGPGVSELSVADRVTISNMSPEFGSTAALFPFDKNTLEYFKVTGRDPIHCEMIHAYHLNQGLLFDPNALPEFSDRIDFDLSAVRPCIAGPGRPQDKIALSSSGADLSEYFKNRKQQSASKIRDGDVVLAAITSCTNTSNPSVLIAAALLAKKALELGLSVPSHIKTSLAPGSQTVMTYLQKANLLEPLEKLGFFLVGFGCTTCIGNSGPLDLSVSKDITDENLNVCAVLSGNRNFEGRIHPLIRSSYLASPPLVVAYALAGNMLIDWEKDPIGINHKTNTPVYLKDLWPSSDEISEITRSVINKELYQEAYKKVFEGDALWQSIQAEPSAQYAWDETSTYLKRPPFLTRVPKNKSIIASIQNARALGLFKNSVTTDHISPAGSIAINSPAGIYLRSKGVEPAAFNSYGARRGHDEVMIRGTFSNPRLKNSLVAPQEGGYTLHWPSQTVMTIFEASEKYLADKTPLVIIAGKEYGTGSSRDWAAKGTKLLGVKTVFAQSYERIHRSNLIGMGVIPLEFLPGENHETYQLTGEEFFDIKWNLSVRGLQTVQVRKLDGKSFEMILRIKIETLEELNYVLNDGILPYVLRDIIKTTAADKE